MEASFIRARYDYSEELDQYTASMVLLYLPLTLMWFFLVLFTKDIFLRFTGIEEKYLLALFLYLFMMPAINLFQNMERFRYRYKASVAISLLLVFSSSFLSIFLVSVLSDRLQGRIWGYVAPVLVLSLGVLFLIFYRAKKISWRQVQQHWRYAIPFSLPFIPHLLSMLFLGSVDRIMIHQLRGAEELALYSLAYTCGSLLTIFVTSINSAYSPWLGEKLSRQEYDMIRQVSIPYVLFFALIACGAVFISPELLWLLGGKNYAEAVWVMPPVAAGCFMQLLYAMYVNVEQYEKKTKGMALASFLAALANVLLNGLLIPSYGYIAAAYTTFAGYFLLLLMHYALVKRIGMSHVYRNKEMMMVAMGVSFFLFMMSFFFPYPLLRYLFLGVLGAVSLWILYRYRSKIQEIRRGGKA